MSIVELEHEAPAAAKPPSIRRGRRGESDAAAHEAKVAARQAELFGRLKDEARALFGMADGVPGVRSPAEWEKLLERAGDEIGNGRFIVRCLGGERYLDALSVATLITFRQSLMAEHVSLSTADTCGSMRPCWPTTT